MKNNKNDFHKQLIDYFNSELNINIENVTYNDIYEVCTAFDNGEPDAIFIISVLIICELLPVDKVSKALKTIIEKGDALEWLAKIADDGHMAARVFLNNYYAKATEMHNTQSTQYENYSGPLVDFGGEKITINRKGSLTPIDAELIYFNEKNTLKLSVNLFFIYSDSINNREAFENSVIEGIKSWEGYYLVFGGQKINVELNITKCYSRPIDSVYVFPVTPSLKASINKRHKGNNNASVFIKENRSFAISGLLKWTVYSRKLIYIVSNKENFTDYEEISASAKHEFGHILGLGDLYFSEKDGLFGVGVGSFPELDNYNNGYRHYDLVMCNNHGKISNNDIEMIILAFRDNKCQLYQKRKRKDKISNALGNGN